MSFGIRRELSSSYDDALVQVTEALKNEGFGVLTEIDVKETLKKKLDVDFRRYKILGACNPPFAHRALLEDLEVGLAMPCNVIVYENDAGKAVVTAIDPTQTIPAGGNAKLAALAEDVRKKLAHAIEQLH